MQELEDETQAEETKTGKKQKKKGERKVDVDDDGAVCDAAGGAAAGHAMREEA